MRFKPKAKRAKASRREGVNFEDYSWDTPLVAGWHPLVVLNAKEDETKKGDAMWVIDLGVDLPDGEGGRVRWRVPDTFPPKVEMLQTVLLAEYEDEDEDFELDPKVLLFRPCVGLIQEDTEFQREDGKASWDLVKIIKADEADEVLGADWMNNRGGDDEAEGEGEPAAVGADDEAGDPDGMF